MKLFFLIRSLDHGGAERQLIELVKAVDKARYEITVATFYDGGGLLPELENVAGVRLVSLGKKGRWDLLPFVWRLARLVREIRPDVLHGYMGIANELCSLMGWLYGGRVVWGIRLSSRPDGQYDWLSSWGGRAGAWFSKSADRIIANSHAGERHCVESGFFAERISVVHNGIDTERFQPDRAAGRALRTAWAVADDAPLVGLVARLDPQKDHQTFLRAAAVVADQRPDVRFVCVGNGPAAYASELAREAEALALHDALRWVPAANNVRAIYNALDLATLTSMNGEGFPNVVGEAMACGVPVVVTDNGDAGFVVGEKEQVVPCGQPEALAAAWLRVLALPPDERIRLGARQRARIVDHFQIRHLVAKTLAAIHEN
ncbi:MAG: glycosyltransferase [Chthoniobacter sp.]|nr:glycosyltransferase [Chthoniobacter sp.]